MSTDESPSVPGDESPRSAASWWAWRHQLGDIVAARVDSLSWPRRVVGAVVVCVVAGITWLALRPASHTPIEARLPRAAVSTTSTGGSGTTGNPAARQAPAVVLVVHVVGAVRKPGVVEVLAGARVLDAVAAAGGPTDDADLQRVNLAAKLVDGQRVAVPQIGAPLPVSPLSTSEAGATEPPTPLNINDATPSQLDALPGVGPATAAAIVAHREQHGPFRSIEALADVRGIGRAKLEQLRPLVSV